MLYMVDNPRASRRPPLSDTVERIRMTRQLSLDEWVDRIRVSKPTYLNFVHGRQQLTSNDLDRIAESAALNPNEIIDGKVDFKTLAMNSEADTGSLDERYLCGKFSRLRTVISVLDGVEEYLGWRARLDVMATLNLSEKLLSDPLQTCNIRLISDICSTVRTKYRADLSLFSGLGAHSTVTYAGTPLAHEFAKYETPGKLYEAAFGPMVPQYEHNHSYQILTLSDEFCSVAVTPFQKVKDEFKSHFISNAENCSVKAGLMSTILGYIGLPCSHVTEIECIYRGNKRCVFDVDFEFSSRVYKQRKEA